MVRGRSSDCDLPDELRCTRSDKKEWRCWRPRMPGYAHCDHHREKFRLNHERRKQKQQNLQLVACKNTTNSISPPTNPTPVAKPPSHSLSDCRNPITCKSHRFGILKVGITENCLKTGSRIRGDPTIIDSIDLPPEIRDLDDLRSILCMDSWNECLSDAERDQLQSFLPKDCGDILKGVLSWDENVFFGNPTQKFWETICRGEMSPKALVCKEKHIKLCRSDYYNRLKNYHLSMINSIEEFKSLYNSIGMDDSLYARVLTNLEDKKSSRAGSFW